MYCRQASRNDSLTEGQSSLFHACVRDIVGQPTKEKQMSNAPMVGDLVVQPFNDADTRNLNALSDVGFENWNDFQSASPTASM
jgi:hypothetical protein